jgi:hypothetical protein
MSNAPPNTKAPLAIFFVLWGGFGLFFFFLGHHWGVEYDKKIEKISRGEEPEIFEVLKILNDDEDTYVRFRREGTDEIVTVAGSARTISVGSKVQAYRISNEWFIPEIHRGGHHWGKWIFLAFGLLPPLLTWIFWRRAEAKKKNEPPTLGDEWVTTALASDLPEPKTLSNRMHRGENFTAGTSIFGMIFCSVFVAIGIAGLYWLSITTERNIPLWVRYIFVLFCPVGAAGVYSSINSYRISTRREEHRRLHPTEAWTFDHEWQTEGAWEESSRAILFAVVFGTGWALFMTLFASIAANEDASVYFFLELFSLVPFGCAGYTVYALMRRAKFGRSYCRFERFPYFLGEEVRVAWKPGSAIGVFKNMHFTLRCIEEREEKDRDDETTQRFYELFAQSITIDQPGEKTDTAEVPLSFTVPNLPRPLGTQFSAKTPRYWELEVKADTPGIKYAANFMVPVYAPPRTTARRGR